MCATGESTHKTLWSLDPAALDAAEPWAIEPEALVFSAVLPRSPPPCPPPLLLVDAASRLGSSSVFIPPELRRFELFSFGVRKGMRAASRAARVICEGARLVRARAHRRFFELSPRQTQKTTSRSGRRARAPSLSAAKKPLTGSALRSRQERERAGERERGQQTRAQLVPSPCCWLSCRPPSELLQFEA